jgi:monoamine oxidase
MDDGPPREVLARIHSALGNAMGDVASAFAGEALRTEWHRDPLTGGAYSTWAPGQLTQFAGLLWYEDEGGQAVQQARDGRILFAGEHVSDAWSGYMNGAAQTGRLAAQTLIAELSQPRTRAAASSSQ